VEEKETEIKSGVLSKISTKLFKKNSIQNDRKAVKTL
jgi:hypothetical protein